MRVDLHMHTGYSADADFPQTIDDKIAACERAGLDIIGLTDHLDFFRRRNLLISRHTFSSTADNPQKEEYTDTACR